MDISLLQAAHGRRNISRFWPRWVDHLLWRSCRSLTMTFPLRFNTQLRGWLNCWKRGLLMFVVNPWPMILKPFCMHFVSFPKTLKYFFGWLWVTSASVRSATLIQRTGARWGTRFAGTCLWYFMIYESFIYSPPWEQGYIEEISGSFRFLGSSFSESLKKGWSIFLVDFTFMQIPVPDWDFCKCPLASPYSTCFLFFHHMASSLHVKKIFEALKAKKHVPRNSRLRNWFQKISLASFYKLMSLKGSYHATPTCSSSLLDHRSCALVDIGWVRSDPKLRTWLQRLMFGSKTYCIWYRNIVLHHTYVIICIIYCI